MDEKVEEMEKKEKVGVRKRDRIYVTLIICQGQLCICAVSINMRIYKITRKSKYV